ncbi:glutamate racemase [Brumimicrobium glaciale]|uniref:Glutamate racemase n=1 Tax=Brumimicrobium glaciale TaxID=200475 RepID=A0A4Q4KR44_9FLAO|nr:glutamate racemase [Brumimicrobium glaciale]RYM35064.1 glutamate racemase [Brumimicrobium glaciale]
MNKSNPIGFFDSGYGGLTVLKEVQKLLPEYDYLYLGDNARAPYGTRTADVVYQYTWEAVKTLFDQGCFLVVLACNTASAKALRRIQQENLSDFPGRRVLGVIRPSAEVVGDFSKNKNIVVLGTEGTIASNTYVDEFKNLSPLTKVNQYACPLWVPLIENAQYNTKEGEAFIKNDLKKILKSFPKADVILLGCTHYPILQCFIEKNVPEGVLVMSQGEIVATSLKSYLLRHEWLDKEISKNNNSRYLTTEDPKVFEVLASTILGIDVNVEHIKIK